MKRLWSGLRALLFVGMFAASLALNAAMFVGGTLYNAASAVFEALTGIRTVASRHATEVAELKGELSAERRTTQELRDRNRRLTADLDNERRLTGELRRRNVAVSDAVEETAQRISARARNSAGREIGSMAGEALPVFGVAVIVGVTALELKDLCDTMKDMDALRRAFAPSVEPEGDTLTVCSMEVPSREELWATVKASPEVAWDEAKDLVPTLEDLRGIDWAGYLGSMTDWVSEALGEAVDQSREVTDRLRKWLIE